MSNHSSTTGTKADSFRRFEVITGVGRRRRWTDEEKARIVAESLDPATTSSAVARRYGLHASQLFTCDRPPCSGPVAMLVERRSWDQRERGRRSWSGLRSRPRGGSRDDNLGRRWTV